MAAAMKLLGDWNWYLPRWLEWHPRVNVEPEPQAAQPAPSPELACALGVAGDRRAE
jgi:RND superfamily putative drug exporter